MGFQSPKGSKLLFTLASSEEICKALAVRLKTHRLAQLLSQQELAASAGISTGTVRTLEQTGQTTLESFVRVVGALGLTNELEALFELRTTSIAEMERAQKPQRRRAPRKVRA